MKVTTVLVPLAGGEPNPVIPVFAEIVLQLLLLAGVVAVVVVVVRLVLRRVQPSGSAGAAPGSLTPEQAYEVAYRFIAEAARAGGPGLTVSSLAASMTPVRDVYAGEESTVRQAWWRAVDETRREQPLPRT